MVFCVLAHPSIAVVDIDSGDVFIRKTGKNHKPLGQKICLEAVAWAYMSQVHHNLIWFGVIRFQGEEYMVDEQVSIDLSSFESKRNDTKTNIDIFKVFCGRQCSSICV